MSRLDVEALADSRRRPSPRCTKRRHATWRLPTGLAGYVRLTSVADATVDIIR